MKLTGTRQPEPPENYGKSAERYAAERELGRRVVEMLGEPSGGDDEYEAFTLGVLTVLESRVSTPAAKVRACEQAASRLRILPRFPVQALEAAARALGLLGSPEVKP